MTQTIINKQVTRLEALIKACGQQGGTIHDFDKDYGVDILTMANESFFFLLWSIYLKRCVQTNPEQYAYSINNIEPILQRMNKAVITRAYNKDGDALRLTCKALGFRNTYTAINEYLAG